MNQLLRILALSFLVILTAGFQATAQDEDENPLADESYDTYKEPFNIKERIFMGGNVGLGFTNNQAFFEMSPFAGVRITDQFHAALGMNYSLTSNKYNGYTEKYHLIGFKTFARYLLINTMTIGSGVKRDPGDPLGGIYAHIEYENNIVKAKDNIGNSAELDTPQSIYVGGGYQQNFHRGFGVFFEFVYDLLHDDTKPYASPWPFALRGGFYYGF